MEGRLHFRQTSAVYLSILSGKGLQFSSKVMPVLKKILFKRNFFRIVILLNKVPWVPKRPSAQVP